MRCSNFCSKPSLAGDQRQIFEKRWLYGNPLEWDLLRFIVGLHQTIPSDCHHSSLAEVDDVGNWSLLDLGLWNQHFESLKVRHNIFVLTFCLLLSFSNWFDLNRGSGCFDVEEERVAEELSLTLGVDIGSLNGDLVHAYRSVENLGAIDDECILD